MAKKRPSKKDKGKVKVKADGGGSITILIPQALWDKIKDNKPEILKDMIRSLFDADELYGISNVSIGVTPNDFDEDDYEGFFKVCDGG